MENFQSCRVCLMQTDVLAQNSLFENNGEDAFSYERLTNIKLKPSNFPAMICRRCSIDVFQAVKIKEIALASSKKIQPMFNTNSPANSGVLTAKLSPQSYKGYRTNSATNTRVPVKRVSDSAIQPPNSVHITDLSIEDENLKTCIRSFQKRASIPKPKEVFKCDECEKVYSTRTALIYHKRDIHPSAQHKKSEWPEPKKCYKCDECEKVYSSRFGVEYHKSDVHSSAQPSIGDQSTFSNFTLNSICVDAPKMITSTPKPGHVIKQNTKRSSQKKIKCDECEGVYSSKYFFRTHKHNCHQKKNFKSKLLELENPVAAFLICQFCTYGFREGKDYELHMKMHEE